MRIQRNVWVTLKYSISDSQGEAINSGSDTVTYLHGGYGTVFPAIERALDGREAGESLELYLEPEDTFGDYDAELVRLEQRGKFPEPLEPGLQFEGVPGDDVDAEPVIYTITEMTDDVVVLDGNHPLAGISLRFAINVVEVREASDEEVAEEAQKSEALFAARAIEADETGHHNGHHHHDDHDSDAAPEGWQAVSRTLH